MTAVRRPVPVLCLAIASACAVVPSASASRPAIPAERGEMVPSFAYQMVDERCAAASVSTAPGGDAWARIDAVVPAPDGCGAAAQQYLVLHRDGRTVDPWANAMYGVPGARLRRCADLLIPDAVGADLHACSRSPGLARDARSRTTIGCWDTPNGDRLTHTRKPRRCIVKGTSGRDGYAFDLRAIRWSSWGGAVARGTARVRAFSSGRPDGRAERLHFTVTNLVRRGRSRSYGNLRVLKYKHSRDIDLPTTTGPRR